MKKIALIGTHGIGKTTTSYGLAHMLKKLRYNAIVLNETARECPLPINQKGTEKSQKWILGKQLMNEAVIHPSVDFAICDRTILDVMVYSEYSNIKLSNAIRQFVLHHLKTYDTIFYLPIRPEYFKGDGQRSGDESYQQWVDKRFRFYVNNLDFDFVVVKNDDNVLNRIMYYLGRKYNLIKKE